MALKKAVSHQRYFKIGVYGKAGSGKTGTSLLFAERLAKIEGGRVAMNDTEHGADFLTLDVPTRAFHPKGFDFDVTNSRSLATVTAEMKALDPKIYKVIIIDSMTHMWRSAQDSFTGDRMSNGQIPMYAWSTIKKRYNELMEFLLNCPMHVIIVGRQGVEYGESETGEDKVIGFKMKAEAETPNEPHILIRMESISSTKKTKPKFLAFFEKDRIGPLQGKTVEMPTFENTLNLLLPYLKAKKQAQIDTQEKSRTDDASVFAEQDHEIAVKSGELSLELRKAINGALDKKALAVIGKRIKLVQEQMVPADVNIIRHMYEETLDRLKKEADPNTGREKMMAAIEPVIMDWEPEQLADFCKLHLDGRTPGWPDGFTNTDLRLIKKAIQDNPQQIAAMMGAAS